MVTKVFELSIALIVLVYGIVFTISARSDVCAVCLMEMWEEARVTPCKHFFHGACLRKWLAVRQVCPLCYSELLDPISEPTTEELRREASPERERERLRERNTEWRELRAIEGARDMWPLMEQ
ncbi:zinc finger, C3HC4 type [Cooperia oncophora]